MFFNSIEFAIFCTIVFVLYWSLFNKSILLRNLFLLVTSYVFYAFWDWRFLILIVISSLSDYIIGLYLDRNRDKRRRQVLLFSSILINIGILGFFKYFNFFIDSFSEIIELVGLNVNTSSLEIILPVGISFYTFQTLSYTIDIYRREIKSTKNILGFFAFVSFFPQLVAGPIERAKNLLPQFFSLKKFRYYDGVEGLRQILWGLFKKVVIADTAAVYVNIIFGSPDSMPSTVLVLGAVFFAFQIYGDFSGYSDIAIGVSKLFGFKIMTNFKYPYFSRDIAEFWKRWHISLSTWFRDYVYIPLGGSRVSKGKILRNILIVFAVSGLWHGANLTFVFWGILNALFFVSLFLRKKHKDNTKVVLEGEKQSSFSEIRKIISTFVIVCFAWIFFRAETLTEAFLYIIGIFSSPFLLTDRLYIGLFFPLIGISALVIIEWLNRHKLYPLQNMSKSTIFNWSAYIVIASVVLIYTNYGGPQPFIYFQF